jgi:hypothetical protein
MKLNEIKRMQQLAGIISESQLNEEEKSITVKPIWNADDDSDRILLTVTLKNTGSTIRVDITEPKELGATFTIDSEKLKEYLGAQNPGFPLSLRKGGKGFAKFDKRIADIVLSKLGISK